MHATLHDALASVRAPPLPNGVTGAAGKGGASAPAADHRRWGAAGTLHFGSLGVAQAPSPRTSTHIAFPPAAST